MLTLILAFINAKYKYDYKELFLGTLVLDYFSIMILLVIFDGAIK